MCVDASFREPITLTRDMYAYKIVRRLGTTTYASMYKPRYRSIQLEYDVAGRGAGMDLIYELGKSMSSPLLKTPGIYCWRSRPPRIEMARADVLLSVKIPEGTQVVFGYGGSARCLETVNAATIIPLKEVETR